MLGGFGNQIRLGENKLAILKRGKVGRQIVGLNGIAYYPPCWPRLDSALVVSRTLTTSLYLKRANIQHVSATSELKGEGHPIAWLPRAVVVSPKFSGILGLLHSTLLIARSERVHPQLWRATFFGHKNSIPRAHPSASRSIVMEGNPPHQGSATS